MNPVIESLARDFKVCKVNVDKNQPLAARYGVSSIPVFLIFKDGKIAAQHVGITLRRHCEASWSSGAASSRPGVQPPNIEPMASAD